MNLCKPLDEVRLRQLLALGSVKRWKRRDVLFRAGDPVSSFFKIRRGIVAVSRTLADGRRQIVAIRTAGDCVGYLETFGRYAFEGLALTDVEACAFDRRKFDGLVNENADLAAVLSNALANAISQAGEAMLVVGKLRSTERIAHFLAEMATLHRQRHQGTGPVPVHMSRGEIADYLGLTLETVSRSIGKLKKQAIIDLVESDEVIVLDDAMLRQIGKVSDDTRFSAIG